MITVESFKGKWVSYLGDGVYASFDGFQMWLETSNGIEITNSIALEPFVWQALLEYRGTIGDELKKAKLK